LNASVPLVMGRLQRGAENDHVRLKSNPPPQDGNADSSSKGRASLSTICNQSSDIRSRL
jgi:hypothetical protein